MKCLTIRNPWPALILSGAKPVECRSRPTSFRGRLVVHAARRAWAAPDAGFWPALEARTGCRVPRPAGQVFSTLVGTVEVVGCVPADDPPAGAAGWVVPGWNWLWLLTDPRPFREPVPFRGGRLGFFDVPDDLLPPGHTPPARHRLATASYSRSAH